MTQKHKLVKRRDRKTGFYCAVCRLRFETRDDDSDCIGLPIFTTDDYGHETIAACGESIELDKIPVGWRDADQGKRLYKTFPETRILGRFIPENFKTKTQLKKMGLEPKGEIVGYLRLRGGKDGGCKVPLYDIYAKPKKSKG